MNSRINFVPLAQGNSQNGAIKDSSISRSTSCSNDESKGSVTPSDKSKGVDSIDESYTGVDRSSHGHNIENGDAETKSIKDALPVSIMLRNCFPPNAYSVSSEKPHSEQVKKFSDNHFEDTERKNNSGKILNQNGAISVEDEDENDTTLDNYQIFTKTNQWRDQAKKIIFLPIEIEIVVTYEFLVQFHSHQKNKHTRSRIRDLFGLDLDSYYSNDTENKSRDCEGFNNEQQVVVLCSKLQDTRSSHPLWDHVNEKLDDLHDILPQENDLWSDLYKAMRIQFRAIVPSKSNGELDGRDSLLNDVADTINCKESKSILLASCPLHPYKLKPISLSNKGMNQDNTLSSLIGASKFIETIPFSLPPNSILIYYSDGTTRVSSELFHLLAHKKLIDTSSSNQRRMENMDVDKFARRFDDDVFDVLEDEGYVKAKFQLGNPPVEKTQTQHHDETYDNDVTNRVIAKAKIQDQAPLVTVDAFSQAVSQATSLQSNLSTARGAFAAAFDSMKIGNDGHKELKLGLIDVTSNKEKESENEDKGAPNPPNLMGAVVNGDKLMVHEIDQNDSTETPVNRKEHSLIEESEIKIEKLESELEQLELDINEEEAILQSMIESRKQTSTYEQKLEDSLFKIESEIFEIEKEVKVIVNKTQQVNFLIEWRQKEMLKYLSQIYPIQVLPDSVYTIRGIHLPNDMHSLTATASDEIISAGLGFVCHVVALCSKYLAIPLRYRVICNSSRSAVRDDNDVFPLFKERVVEKEQFDRAIVLLHRNIDLLIQMSGISSATMNTKSKPAHILSKLKYLFISITENHL